MKEATMVGYRIELVGMPVSDEVRFIQVTPPGSACSIGFGRAVSEMAPGSLNALQVVVASADEAHADLAARSERE